MGKIGGAAGAIVLLAVVSCSLTTPLDGLSNGGADETLDGTEAGTEASTSSDASGDTGASFPDVVAPSVDGCSGTGCFVMPSGFRLVAFGATAKSVACPKGFNAPTDTVEGPALAAGACSCACSVTAQPSCATGALAGHFDTAGSGLCDSAGGDLANNGCGTDGYLGPFGAGNEHKFKPPAPTGGTCSAVANKDPTKLTYAALGRVCEAAVVPQCDGKVCPPSVAAPFGACIGTTGDVACPAGFPNKHVLGTGANFTCSTGCTCGVTATCKGKLNYFASGDCSGAVGMFVIVDDGCHSTDAAGASFLSHAYVPFNPQNVACTKTGSTTPSTPALSEAETICCN